MFWFGKRRPEDCERPQGGETGAREDSERAKMQLLVVLGSLPRPTGEDGVVTFRHVVEAFVQSLHTRPSESFTVIGQLLPDALNAYSALHPDLELGAIDAKTALRLFNQCEDAAREVVEAEALRAERDRKAAEMAEVEGVEEDGEAFAEEMDSESPDECQTCGGDTPRPVTGTWMPPLDEERLSYELDRLFDEARRYRDCDEYKKMLEFVSKTKWLGAYNAVLVETQQPGTHYALSAWEWKKKGWRPRHMARPLVILNHRPVGFVFDISEIEPDPEWGSSSRPTKDDIYRDAIRLLAHPFAAEGEIPEAFLKGICRAMAWHGVRYEATKNAGSDFAGNIRLENNNDRKLSLIYRRQTYHWHAGFVITVSADQDVTTQFSTLCHELGHLFCYHLPPPPNWAASRATHSQGRAEKGRKTKTNWEDRKLNTTVKEIEAEAVSYLVCARLGLKASSPRYLSSHISDTVPREVSTERIMRAVDTIERLFKVVNKEAARPDPITDCWLYRYDAAFRDEYKKWKKVEYMPIPSRNIQEDQKDLFHVD